MTVSENLDAYLGTYANDPYERENLLTIAGLAERAGRYGDRAAGYLELGIGHGIAVEALSAAFPEVVVLEGSAELVRRYADKFPNVHLVHTYFEDWVTDRSWKNVGMGFVLEHVDDPEGLLRKYRGLIAPNGSLFVGVPNARSLHRLLGQRLGVLPDLALMSATDRAFGHKRFLTYHEWVAMFDRTGYRVVRAEGLYLKPLTTAQLDQVALPLAAHRALADFASEAPTLSNSCFFQLTPAGDD